MFIFVFHQKDIDGSAGLYEYEATLHVEGEEYKATGRTKKVAKSNVAGTVLKTLLDRGDLERLRTVQQQKRMIKKSRGRGGQRRGGRGGGGEG